MDEKEFLEGVELRLAGVLAIRGRGGDDGQDLLLTAARHLCLAGGKRVRPRLARCFGLAVGAPGAAMLDAGVAAELMHAASLLHDDVIDEGRLRRGRPTANARWGNQVAVLGGDLLLSLAFAQLRDWPRVLTTEALELIAEMTRATIAEVEARGCLELSVDEWRAIAEGKTGALFGWCGRAAAHAAGDAEAAERFDRCGRHLGVAFQLADDLADLRGSGDGKDRFADIRNRAPNHPMLSAIAACATVRDKLARAWRKPELDWAEVLELGEAVLRTGAEDRTHERMEAEIEAAVEALGRYRDRPGGMEIAGWAVRLSRGVLQLREGR